jgi:hypothetical protein
LIFNLRSPADEGEKNKKIDSIQHEVIHPADEGEMNEEFELLSQDV